MLSIMSEQTTKERILLTGEEIMLERSFHSVGLKQILDTANVPKGSFYHYFKSKEQFGVEMLRHYMDAETQKKRSMFFSEDAPLEKLFTSLERVKEHTQSDIDKFPCLALKLAAEVSDMSEAMRKELERGFKQWIAIFFEVFENAKEKNMLPETFNSDGEAQFIHDLITGAVHRSVINRSPEPVWNAVDIVKSRIEDVML